MDKPAGLTSHDVVSRVRRVLQTRAVGHTGTLDPFATGLLVLLVGRATRLARFVEQQAKTYLATAQLGLSTTTDDATGQPLGGLPDRRPGAMAPPGSAAVAAALAGFVGPQRQRPATFSAKKVGGERAYALARRGAAVELAEVEIVIHALELVRYVYPQLQFRATVSAGTYVRALARDLGARLGTGAHLIALRREAIGALRVEMALSLEALTPAALLPPLAVLGHLPRLPVSAAQAMALSHGQSIAIDSPPPPGGDPVAAVGPDDTLVAVGRLAIGTFRPEVVLEAGG